MENNIKTHRLYANYPLDSLHLRELQEDVDTLEVSSGDIVIIDCKGMSYICSSGLRAFLTMHKDITAKTGKLIIRNLEPLVKGVFDMSGFSHIFNIE